MKGTHLTRRTFLRAVGTAAAALPVFRALEASVARAEGAAGPLRLVVLYHPHGASSPLYGMRPGETETDFDLTYPDCVLSPFDDAATYGRSFKDRLLILEGVDLASAIEAGRAGHDAPSSLLTGSGGAPPNASLDQYLAVERGLGAGTRVSSLVLGVGNAATGLSSCISYGPGGAPLNKLIDPRATFDTVFSGFTPEGDADAQARAERERRRGQSVIDYLRGDLQRLHVRLAPAEQQKLDQHLTSIRELEKRLQALPTPVPGCTVPTRPEAFPRLHAYNGGEPYFDAITDLQVDLIAQAMACDITRFATLWMNDLSRGAADGAGLTGVPDDCHQDLAHAYSAPIGSHYGGGSPGEPSTWSALGVQHRYSYSKAARLLQRFHQYGILEDVIVLMVSDMGNPSLHSSRNVPLLLAGGCGGRFRMGRRLRMQDDCPPDRWYCRTPTLIPHNRVLVSIAQAFGLSDVEAFGHANDPSIPVGELSALR